MFQTSICGVSYAPDMEPRLLTAFRVIADHVRALSIAMADGAMPDRKGRGSVLRSLLRRAARFGRQSLDIREPFVHLLAPRVADVFSDVFPEVGQRMEHITLVLRAEEESFNRTIDRGIERRRHGAAQPDNLGTEALRCDRRLRYRPVEQGRLAPQDSLRITPRRPPPRSARRSGR